MSSIYLDTEFNGFGGNLLSLAMVTSENEEWYEVLEYDESKLDPWVQANVLPELKKSKPLPYKEFRESFLNFMKKQGNASIFVDWPSDLVYFFQLILGENHTQTFFAGYKTQILEDLIIISEVPHHALHDARAIKKAHLEYLLVRANLY